MSDFHERDAAPRRARQATRSERPARARALRGLAVSVTAMAVLSGTAGTAHAALPPGNAAQQWDQIAQDTVVGSGAFQGEGFVYTAYVAKAMHGAVSPGERRGQSADAAVAESACARHRVRERQTSELLAKRWKGACLRAASSLATIAVGTPANIPHPGDFSGGPGDSLEPELMPPSDRL